MNKQISPGNLHEINNKLHIISSSVNLMIYLQKYDSECCENINKSVKMLIEILDNITGKN